MSDVRIVAQAIANFGAEQFYWLLDQVIQDMIRSGAYEGDHDVKYTKALVETARRLVR